MLDWLIKTINKSGDWNHGIVGTLILSALVVPATILKFDVRPFLYDVSIFITGFYLGRETNTYGNLGEFKSFCMNLWKRHDRRQTIIAWSVVWVYAFIYDKFVYNFLTFN